MDCSATAFTSNPISPRFSSRQFRTIVTLLVAYPFALAIARSSPRVRPILLGFAIAPFWTSFLIRVYAWIAILKDEGLLNHFF